MEKTRQSSGCCECIEESGWPRRLVVRDVLKKLVVVEKVERFLENKVDVE